MTKRFRSLLLAAPLLAVSLGACSDTEFITGGDDAASLCNTADCINFRNMDPARIQIPLRAAVALSGTSIRNEALRARMNGRLQSLLSDFAGGRKAPARLGLSVVLADLQRASNDPVLKTDQAVLHIIRLHLEPLSVNLGFR